MILIVGHAMRFSWDDLAWFLAMHTVMVLLPTLQAANIAVVTTQQQVSVPIGD